MSIGGVGGPQGYPGSGKEINLDDLKEYVELLPEMDQAGERDYIYAKVAHSDQVVKGAFIELINEDLDKDKVAAYLNIDKDNKYDNLVDLVKSKQFEGVDGIRELEQKLMKRQKLFMLGKTVDSAVRGLIQKGWSPELLRALGKAPSKPPGA